MASGTKASVTIGKEVLEKLKGKLDRLTTREAQVIRMRYGISEQPTVRVGGPVDGVPVAVADELEAAEGEVISRLRDGDSRAERSDVKGKIVDSLKGH